MRQAIMALAAVVKDLVRASKHSVDADAHVAALDEAIDGVDLDETFDQMERSQFVPEVPPATPRPERVTVGRIVHFVMNNGRHRPGIIVENWGNVEAFQGGSAVNLFVFPDGTNDPTMDCWETSVSHDSQGTTPRTWHWPERE